MTASSRSTTSSTYGSFSLIGGSFRRGEPWCFQGQCIFLASVVSRRRALEEEEEGL